MIQELELPEASVEAKDEPNLCHRICLCNEFLAICGKDVTDDLFIEYEEESPAPACPTCVELTPFWLCPWCGLRWDEED